MALFLNNKKISKKGVISYGIIILGCFLLSIGFNFFITPHHIIPGGVYGIGIIFNDLTQGMFWKMGEANGGFPVGTAGFILDIPITITGIIILGPRFGFKTVFGLFMCMIFMDYCGIPKMALVPGDPLVSAIFGGILIGGGVGLIFKADGASGGTDTIAMILNKFTKLPLGLLVILVDSCIVLFGLIAFRDWAIPLYSWIAIFVSGKMIDLFLKGFVMRKALFIISDKHEEISKFILTHLERGGTYFNGSGMYTNNEKKIIFTAVNRKQLLLLQEAINEIDSNAFVTIMETNEILGDGFKSLSKKIR